MQIFNKKKNHKQFYIGDRDFLRDKRLSADAKNIYIVLNSLAETCENICPSYNWIAQEIGYKTEGKEYRSITRFISTKLDELINLNLIKKIVREGTSCDFEVYDYTPDKNVPGTPDKKVQGTLYKNVPLERREEKEEVRVIVSEKPEREEISEMIKTSIKAKLQLEDSLAERVFGLIEIQFWSHYEQKNIILTNPDTQFTSWCLNRWSDIEKIKREEMKTQSYLQAQKDYQDRKKTGTKSNWNESEKEYQGNLRQERQTIQEVEQLADYRDQQTTFKPTFDVEYEAVPENLPVELDQDLVEKIKEKLATNSISISDYKIMPSVFRGIMQQDDSIRIPALVGLEKRKLELETG